MALHPVCDEAGVPKLLHGEEILIKKEPIVGTIRPKNSHEFKFWGVFYLTNARIIIINYSNTTSTSDFALHLNLISQESKFNKNKDLIFRGKFDRFLQNSKFEGTFEFYFTYPYIKIVEYLDILLYSIRSSRNVVAEAYVNPDDPDKIIVAKK